MAIVNKCAASCQALQSTHSMTSPRIWRIRCTERDREKTHCWALEVESSRYMQSLYNAPEGFCMLALKAGRQARSSRLFTVLHVGAQCAVEKPNSGRARLTEGMRRRIFLYNAGSLPATPAKTSPISPCPHLPSIACSPSLFLRYVCYASMTM